MFSFSLIAGVAVIVALVAGITVGYYLRKMSLSKQRDSIEAKMQQLVNDARNKEKEILLQAKDKAIHIMEEAKAEEKQALSKLDQDKRRLSDREHMFDKQLLALDSKKQDIEKQQNDLRQAKEEVVVIRDQQKAKLQEIANLDPQVAQNMLLEQIEREQADVLNARRRKLEMITSDELERRGKQLLSEVIQRCASSHATETTTTNVAIPSEEMKGRIIGREGRNIKTIEHLTGVEIIVDDTPGVITISGFSPIRRHVAKKSLEKLIADGRIQPARIEQTIEEAKKEIALDIKKSGEEAIYELGITGLDPKLVQIIGRLKYRTSYGQNILHHSVEVAHLSAMLAEELGADVNVAKKGGLLHDIGKAVDHEVQGTHTEIGRDIAKKFNVPDDIIAPIAEHHNDHPSTLEAVIVKVADAISGARPGARKDTFENYVQRLQELEDIATTVSGVDHAYAIQAGREVRVFVKPENVDDVEAHKIAKEIATNIENQLKYPGEIKVTVIRDKRIIEFAR